MTFQSKYGGLQFRRTQIPLKYAFTVTVHKSKGVTLSKAVVDLRHDLWEHGQHYVALLRIKDPINLCVLLPDDTNFDIIPVSDQITVDVVRHIESTQKHFKDSQLISYLENYQINDIPKADFQSSEFIHLGKNFYLQIKTI